MKGYRRIHAYAQCEKCGWDYTDIHGHDHKHDVGRKAQQHANKTGHTVDVEIGFYKTYKPQE